MNVKCEMNYSEYQSSTEAKRIKVQRDFEMLAEIRKAKNTEMRSGILEKALKTTISTSEEPTEVPIEKITEELTTLSTNSRGVWNGPTKKCALGSVYVAKLSSCRKITNK